MICIFCKVDSTDSKSIEHIVPESLGGKYFLEKGIVCDNCNNYFAVKVEKPFLEHETLMFLRSDQAIPNKKGKIPMHEAILLPDFSVQIQPLVSGHRIMSLEPDAIRYLMQQHSVTIEIKGDYSVPTGPTLSRMIAKMALEAMAHRIMSYSDGINYLANHEQLDLIRNHARRGDNANWPVNKRKIYNVDAAWKDEVGLKVQVLHEHDILHTDKGEYYFIIILFGIEFVINYGGPEIDGYLKWLEDNNGISPLYSKKNSDFEIKPWHGST